MTTVARERGEFAAPSNTAFSAEKQPVGNSPWRGEIPTTTVPLGHRGEFPTVENGRTCYIPPHAPASLKDSSIKESLLNGLNELNEVKDLNDFKDASAAEAGEPTLSEGERAYLRKLQRQLERRQASAPKPAEKEIPVAAVVASAAPAAFSPESQKQRLVAELRSLINDPGTAEWLYGYAADLMLVHGQDRSRADAEAIFTRMQKLIGELRLIREADDRYRGVRGPRGAWFNIRMTAIARDHRVKLPCELKAARQQRGSPNPSRKDPS